MKAAIAPGTSLSKREQMKKKLTDMTAQNLLFGSEPKFKPKARTYDGLPDSVKDTHLIDAADTNLQVDAESMKLGDNKINTPSASAVDADRVKASRMFVDEGQAQVDSYVYSYTYNPIYGTRHTRADRDIKKFKPVGVLPPNQKKEM